MGMLDMATYTQLQAADAMRDAAQNPSGGAGLTAGIGAGMGLGTAIGDAIKQSRPGGEGEPSGEGPGDVGGPPDVMTPSEAAKFLRVAEEDVIAAIEAGDLKAKKLGKAYRISRGSLEEFLKS